MQVEVCCNSLESALNAQRAGADRIELCSELGVGGITPSYGLLKSVREQVSVPVNVLIRPRGGDFSYSQNELEVMKKDIELCATLGFNGVVSGVLKPDFTLDAAATEALVKNAGPMMFTFHRAFDWVVDPMATLLKLEEMGVSCILSSGQQKTAVEGIGLLNQINQAAKQCTIMPGGGIRFENCTQFKDLYFKIIHFTATTFHRSLDRQPAISMNSDAFLREDHVAVADAEKAKAIIKRVK